MNRRKDDLRALLLGGSSGFSGENLTALTASEVKSATPRPRSTDLDAEAPGRVTSGAVRAMGLSLGNIRRDAEDSARALEAKSSELDALRADMAAGGAIIELDPAAIEASFAADRLGGAGEEGPDDPDFAGFVEDIRQHGQQVPILVRPHPLLPGRFEIAYGHRRWRAARRLEAKVRAVVRSLSDVELVVAQGQENAQRRDLSFIEKAFFALALDQRGFDRATLCGALAVQTAEITRLLSVARAVPASLAGAIGPAPKAGRPRWLQLVEGLERPDAKVRMMEAMASDAFLRAGSDDRFVLVFEALFAHEVSGAPAREITPVLTDDAGRILARREGSSRETRLILDERFAPDFAALIIARLPALYAQWRSGATPDSQLET